MKPLTKGETEVMTVLWKLGEGSVHDVLADLSKTRKLAYTTVSTVLRLLEQKKVIRSRRKGRGHIYIPKFSKPEYDATMIERAVTKAFDEAPVALVQHLFDRKNLTTSDLKEIRKLIDEKLKDDPLH